MSTDTYHPKTVWMTQGATHLRCSSGAEIGIAGGGTLTVSSGGSFTNKGPRCTTATKNTSTLDPNGMHAINTSGVYLINPTRGSICRIWVHTTANAFFKGSSAVDAVRFPSSKMRVLKVKATTKDQKRWGPGFAIYGMTTHRAYVGGLGGFSSDAHDTHLVIAETSST